MLCQLANEMAREKHNFTPLPKCTDTGLQASGDPAGATLCCGDDGRVVFRHARLPAQFGG